MLITNAALTALTTSFSAVFSKAFAGKKPTWEKIATRVPSTTSENLYGWLGALPKFREWVGDRALKSISEEGYSIANKLFEMTVSVPKTAIEDDQYGMYGTLVQQMGESAALYPDDLVFEVLKKGFTDKGYDKAVFFSGDHKGKDKAKQSNLSHAKLTADSYSAARAAMMSLVDEEGKAMKITPTLLIVPPALEAMGLKILKADQIDNTTNIYKGTAELFVAPELAGKDDAWYLLDTSKALKPIIFQERKAPKFDAQTDPTSDAVFMRSQYVYGCEARGNAGFGLWQQAYGSDGTAI